MHHARDAGQRHPFHSIYCGRKIMTFPLKRGAFALGALASLAAAQPAQATIFTVAWEGTLDSGLYQADISSSTIDLTGRAFQVVYTIDDSLGFDVSSPPYRAYVYGGSLNGMASPVSAVFTIDGVGSYSIRGDYDAFAIRDNYDPGVG